MTALSEQKIQIVRTLVERAPDPVVGKLQAALAQAGGDEALLRVRQLVDLEAADRRLRNAVLAPIAPLCVGDGRATDRLLFPAPVLGLTWRGLKQAAPAMIDEARAVVRDLAAGEDSFAVFDDLALLAGAQVRSGEIREFALAGQAAEAARPNGADLLATCLELSQVVRRGCERLPDWINRMAEDETAQVRVIFKDAVAVRSDSGPLFFEMLSAQLARPYEILRVISGVMDGAHEHYFAASELALFPERLMDRIDAELEELAAADADGGAAAASAAAAAVDRVTAQIAEIRTTIELDRDGGWGRRVAGQRSSLAQAVELRLKELEKAVAAALPTRVERVARMSKSVPKVAQPPDEALVGRATMLLQFAEKIRPSASQGGFASSRAKAFERMAEFLDGYVEDLLDRIRNNEVESPQIARAYLDVAADFAAVIDPKAAQVIRRRASAG